MKLHRLRNIVLAAASPCSSWQSPITLQNLGFNISNYRKYDGQEEKDKANKGSHATYDAYGQFPRV
jgi:hypothetical protein